MLNLNQTLNQSKIAGKGPISQPRVLQFSKFILKLWSQDFSVAAFWKFNYNRLLLYLSRYEKRLHSAAGSKENNLICSNARPRPKHAGAEVRGGFGYLNRSEAQQRMHWMHELLTDSIALLMSRIDIDEFKPLDFHEIEALVECFARKNHRCTGMKSRFHEEAEPKRSMSQSTRATWFQAC